MIGAIVINNIVRNLIVLNEAQIEELSTAFHGEIVDARPYGLAKGDLRTAAGWTRNADGEQIILPLLENKSQDSYSVVANENAELTKSVAELTNQVSTAEATGADRAIEEMMAILDGEEEAGETT